MILNRIGGLDVEETTPVADPATGYRSDVNPVGKIPALRLADGEVLVDSPVICEWLDRKGLNLLSNSDDEFAQRSLHAIGDGLSTAVYDYRYETVRDDALHWPQMISRKTAAIGSVLDWLEARTDRLGETLGWGGLAVGCALDYCAYRAGHVDWQNRAPRLADWHRAVCRTPVWRETFAYPA